VIFGTYKNDKPIWYTLHLIISQLNKVILLIFIALLWSSCSDKTEYEILNSEEILPQAQGNYDYSEDSSDSIEEELTPIQELLLQLFPDVNFDEENILKDRKMLFIPNRLGFKSKAETFFIIDSIPFHFIEWEFEDSLKTVNAFYNWLDCFDHDCKSIRIDEEINGSKESFIIWVSDFKITYFASSKNINRSRWQSIFLSNQKKEFNYVIHQAPRGKMNWVVK